MYGHRLNDERLYKSTLQRMKREPVFLESYHTLIRKCKCVGISVIISLSRATNGTVFFLFFFTVKLDPINSFPSNTAEVRHVYVADANSDDRGDYKYLFLYLCFSIRN